MSATVVAFNEMLGSFLEELCLVFPDEPDLQSYKSGFDLMKMADPKAPLNLFMDNIKEHQSHVMSKDEAYFFGDDAPQTVIKDLGIDKHWKQTLSQENKDAIWQYLQTLTILGTTISSVPPELLKSIESIAESCTQQQQQGDAPPPGGGGGGIPGLDLSQLGSLASMLGNMPGMMGGNNK